MLPCVRGHSPGQALALVGDLLACGGDPNPVDPISGLDALTRALHLQSLEAATLLASAGARLKVPRLERGGVAGRTKTRRFPLQPFVTSFAT